MRTLVPYSNRPDETTVTYIGMLVTFTAEYVYVSKYLINSSVRHHQIQNPLSPTDDSDSLQ